MAKEDSGKKPANISAIRISQGKKRYVLSGIAASRRRVVEEQNCAFYEDYRRRIRLYASSAVLGVPAAVFAVISATAAHSDTAVTLVWIFAPLLQLAFVFNTLLAVNGSETYRSPTFPRNYVCAFIGDWLGIVQTSVFSVVVIFELAVFCELADRAWLTRLVWFVSLLFLGLYAGISLASQMRRRVAEKTRLKQNLGWLRLLVVGLVSVAVLIGWGKWGDSLIGPLKVEIDKAVEEYSTAGDSDKAEEPAKEHEESSEQKPTAEAE